MVKILLIEDETRVADELEVMFKTCGHQVRTVLTADAGKDVLVRESIELVVLDVWMGLKGKDFCGWFISYLRANKRLRNIKVVIFSGDEKVSEIGDRYAVRCVHKPLAHKLMDVIDELFPEQVPKNPG